MPTPKSDAKDAIPRLAARLIEILAKPENATSGMMIATFREFPEFTEAKSETELWFGFKTKQALLEKLVQQAPRLAIDQNTGGAYFLRLADQVKTAELVIPLNNPPTIEAIGQYCFELSAASTLPIPLAQVALALEAEFGQGVRQSGWLGKKTLKALLTDTVVPRGLRIDTKSPGFLLDPRRHKAPA